MNRGMHLAYRSAMCGMLLALLVCIAWIPETHAGSTLFFGKFKWGQDETSLFITVYCPEMDVKDATIAINDTHFSVTGPNPKKKNEPLDLTFEFREDVVSANMTWKAWVWKAGSKPNSMFFTIPKRHEHFFDRLVFNKVDRAFKKRMEIDWNRYKRTIDDDSEEGIEDDEEEAWEDDYDRKQKGNVKELTNDNFHKKLSANPYTVLLATYPWCQSCRKEEFTDAFAKVARSKSLKKKVAFAKVDLRQQRWVGRDLAAGCPDDCSDNIFVYRRGDSEGKINLTLGAGGEKEEKDAEQEKALAYLLRYRHTSPWPLASMDDVESMRSEGDKMMPIGVFGDGHEEQKAAFIQYAQEKRGNNHHGIITTPDPSLLQQLLPDMTELPKPPLIIISKNFGIKEEDTPLVYGTDPKDTFTQESIAEFIKFFNFKPLVWVNSSIGDNDEAKLSQRKLPVAHLWVDKADRHAQVMTSVRRAAVQLQRKVAFVYHDMAAETKNPNVAQGYVSEAAANMILDYGLDGSLPPKFGLDGHSKPDSFSKPELSYKKYPFEEFTGQTSDTEIVAWIQKVMAGEVAAGHRSEAEPSEAVDDSKANKLVAKTFENHLMNNEHDVIVNMYRSDQPHYKIARPELRKVATALDKVNANFQVFHYCWDKNEVPESSKELEMIKRFTPVGTSLVFFLPAGKGGHGVQRYVASDQGQHSASSILDFVFQHVSKPFDLTSAKSAVEELAQDEPSPYAAMCGSGSELCKKGFSCEFNVCHWTGSKDDLVEHKKTIAEEKASAEKNAAAEGDTATPASTTEQTEKTEL